MEEPRLTQMRALQCKMTSLRRAIENYDCMDPTLFPPEWRGFSKQALIDMHEDLFPEYRALIRQMKREQD